MAQGQFDLTGSTGDLSTPYLAPGVFRFDPTNPDSPFARLPNVVCTHISENAGPAPPAARFRYIQDDNLDANMGWPARVDELWPLDATGPYVVNADDRIVVMTQDQDGNTLYLFDGFAQIPECALDGRDERATFAAVGVAIREFDNPISGRVQRDSDPEGIRDTSGDSDVETDLPCRFNPADRSYGDDGGFRPNRTPDNYDTTQADDSEYPTHPVFVQEGIEGRDADKSPAYWSIADALKYLLAEFNPDSKYTEYPALGTLDSILNVVYAKDDTAIFDAGDIQTDPLLIRDYDASNRPWPEAVAELLGYAGFLMRWDLQADSDGMPATYLRIYRADMMSETPKKSLYLDAPGNSLADGSPNNVVRAHLARDSNAIVNAWQVETSQRTVEIGIYLAPLYQPVTGDASASAWKQYTLSSLKATDASAAMRRKYRWYGVDELADGHYDLSEEEWVTDKPFDFTGVFPTDEDTGAYTYCNRYRPAAGHLATTDDEGGPIRARLDVAFGVDLSTPAFVLPGDVPAGTKWFNIPGGWRLLPDRLGIEVIVDNPEEWTFKGQESSGTSLLKLSGISWWADPSKIPAAINGVTTDGKAPVLRLTCVIQDDLRMPISAGKRKGSPTKFARWRVADARDHFQYVTIDKSSANWAAQGGTGTDPVVVRDDTKAATDHARALRSAHEMPPLAGSVTLQGINPYYGIGDRVDRIKGRDIKLYTNAGTAQGELPSYPVVVCREYHLEPRVYTTIHLTDLRARQEVGNAW